MQRLHDQVAWSFRPHEPLIRRSLKLSRLAGSADTAAVSMQCVVKTDKKTGKRVVAGTHWDFDSYGGTIKKQLGLPTQAGSSRHVINDLLRKTGYK